MRGRTLRNRGQGKAARTKWKQGSEVSERKRGRKNGLPRNRSNNLGTFSLSLSLSVDAGLLGNWPRIALRGRPKDAGKNNIYRSSLYPFSFDHSRPSGRDTRPRWTHGPRDWLTIVPCIKLPPPPSPACYIFSRSTLFRASRIVRARFTTRGSWRIVLRIDFRASPYFPCTHMCTSPNINAFFVTEGGETGSKTFLPTELTDCISNKSRILLTRHRRATAKLNGARKTCLSSLPSPLTLMFFVLVAWSVNAGWFRSGFFIGQSTECIVGL